MLSDLLIGSCKHYVSKQHFFLLKQLVSVSKEMKGCLIPWLHIHCRVYLPNVTRSTYLIQFCKLMASSAWQVSEFEGLEECLKSAKKHLISKKNPPLQVPSQFTNNSRRKHKGKSIGRRALTSRSNNNCTNLVNFYLEFIVKHRPV